MADGSNTFAQELVRLRTSRDPEDLLRELYVEKRHSQAEIAKAIDVSRTTVSTWLREWGITREARPPVAL